MTQMTLTKMTRTVDSALAEWKAALTSMLDPLDIPRAWTSREVNAYEEKRALLSRLVNVATAALSTLAEVEPQIARLTTEQSDLVAIRHELSEDLVACPPSPRNRAEMDRRDGLEISILCIDGRFNLATECYPATLQLFPMLEARGYTAPAHAGWNPMAGLYGSLPAIEDRLAGLRRRQAEAQGILDAVLRPETVTV